jgi:2-polyprenyl-6-methoxyphenol hydroxylase-like FAD-dependent oxidoreductase
LKSFTKWVLFLKARFCLAFYNKVMARPLDVCIRGAGIVGRTLALLLAGERLRVGLVSTPHEQPDSTTDVRAYALNAQSRALLESVRCWPDEVSATPVLGMHVRGDDGGEVNFRASDQGTPALAWIVDVAALQSRLAEAIRFQPLIEELTEPQSAALTVVCEGKASRTRTEFGVEFDVTPYGQRAIAARVTCEKPHQQLAHQWFLNGEILAFLPLNGEAGNSMALVWSVMDDRVDSLMSMGTEEFTRALQEASHGAMGGLTLISERATWPLQLARANRWVGETGGKSWALAGDAAHTVHPLSGQGLNLGLADVDKLAQVLKARDYWRSVGDQRLLRQYERARKVDVMSVGFTTDGLQQLFAQDAMPWSTVRNWGMRGFDASGAVKKWVARQAMGLG